MRNWQEIVPEYVLRPQQIEALDRIDEAFESVGVVIFEAPTGIGKSIIELALSRAYGNGFIVTPQKTLQNQLGTLPGVKVMKGRGSYPCLLSPGTSAGAAPCVKSAVIRESYSECKDDVCPYFKALSEAKSADIVAHNYASLIAQARIGGHFDTREIICLDEGHTAVDWIRNYMSVELTEDDLSSLTTDDPPESNREFMGWFRAMMGDLDEVPDGLSEKLVQTCIKVLSHRNVYGVPDGNLYEQYTQEMSEEIPEDREPYISWASSRLTGDEIGLVPMHVGSYHSEEEGRVRKLTPIKVAAMSNILTGLGRKIIVVTATALDADMLARELGLKSRGYEAVVTESAFDKSRRPIKREFVGKMGYSYAKATFPKLIKKIENIISDHANEAGIIHTVSHRLANEICSGLSYSRSLQGRRLVQMPIGGDREGTISKFLTGGFGLNAILIGPGLMEGIDGADESARWQIMCKVPWLFRKNPVVEHWLDSHSDAKMQRFGRKWYEWKTAQTCVQGFGRVCRSNTDFGVTYLLDSDFQKILDSDFIPDYITEAVQ